MTVADEEANGDRIASGHQPIAIVLDLMDPIGTGRRTFGSAGLDEAGRGATLQHTVVIAAAATDGESPGNRGGRRP